MSERAHLLLRNMTIAVRELYVVSRSCEILFCVKVRRLKKVELAKVKKVELVR
jgi:hypothetical protein